MSSSASRQSLNDLLYYTGAVSFFAQMFTALETSPTALAGARDVLATLDPPPPAQEAHEQVLALVDDTLAGRAHNALESAQILVSAAASLAELIDSFDNATE